MNLYLISQKVHQGFDTYDSAIVCAPSIESAKYIHPGKYAEWNGASWGGSWIATECWCSPEEVIVVEIGTANPDVPEGVVCASFNAG